MKNWKLLEVIKGTLTLGKDTILLAVEEYYDTHGDGTRIYLSQERIVHFPVQIKTRLLAVQNMRTYVECRSVRQRSKSNFYNT